MEVLAREFRLLNEAKTPPFQVAEDSPVSEDYVAGLKSRFTGKIDKVTIEVK